MLNACHLTIFISLEMKMAGLYYGIYISGFISIPMSDSGLRLILSVCFRITRKSRTFSRYYIHTSGVCYSM